MSAATAATELTLAGPDGDPQRRSFDVSHERLTDASGRPAGVLVVLHEITERVRDQQHLQGVLEEQSRVASALQASTAPPKASRRPWHRTGKPVPACG